MQIYTGTSGFSYPAWRGTFYPEKLPTTRMLEHYASQLGTVEINNTFYRMPKPETLTGWAALTPPGFRFAPKAPQQITHRQRLVGSAESTALFWKTVGVLGQQLGPALFQLPPNMKKDLGRLTDFLALLPAGARAAFEFRHESWLDEEIYGILRNRNLALCVADSEKLSTPVVMTADYAYFRLRDEGYQPSDIDRWASTIGALSGITDAFVYFKHEEEGLGPQFAQRLIGSLGEAAA